MPLCKRKPFPLVKRPQDLKPQELVFLVRLTKEIFRDYGYPSLLSLSLSWNCLSFTPIWGVRFLLALSFLCRSSLTLLLCLFLTCDISSEYMNRINLYCQRVWTCKVTGKTNLTFEEALASEKQAMEKVQQFPKELVAPVLHDVQFSKDSLPSCINYFCRSFSVGFSISISQLLSLSFTSELSSRLSFRLVQ